MWTRMNSVLGDDVQQNWCKISKDLVNTDHSLMLTFSCLWTQFVCSCSRNFWCTQKSTTIDCRLMNALSLQPSISRRTFAEQVSCRNVHCMVSHLPPHTSSLHVFILPFTKSHDLSVAVTTGNPENCNAQVKSVDSWIISVLFKWGDSTSVVTCIAYKGKR